MRANRTAFIAWLIAGLGYGVAAASRAAISWDGSWYLFSTLEKGRAFIPNGRWVDWLTLSPVAAARDSLSVPHLIVFYGALLVAPPLCALALSFYFLRSENLAALRIWPALGILLAALPGQFCLTTEATLAAQLIWPLLAILVSGLTNAGAIWLALICSLSFFLHPTAAAAFAIGAFICWRARWKTWATIFVALTIGRVVWTFVFATSYERQQIDLSVIAAQFAHSIGGWAGVFLIGALLLGASRRALFRAGIFFSLAGIWWALDPVRWSGGLDYRRFVLPVSLLFLAGGFIRWRRPAAIHPNRLLVISAVFALVMIAQAFSWNRLLHRFANSLQRDELVVRADVPFINGTALDHWSSFSLSLLLQGREPRTFFVLQLSDIDANRGIVHVNEWDRQPLDDGWFHLRPIGK